MSVNTWWLFLLLPAFGVSGFYLWPKLSKLLEEPSTTKETNIQLLIPDFIHSLNRLKLFRVLKSKAFLYRAGILENPGSFVDKLLICFCLLMLVFAWHQSLLTAFILAVSFSALYMLVTALINIIRWQSSFVKHFPSAVRIVNNGIQSGLPLGKTFELVSKHLTGSVKVVFDDLLLKQKYGVTLDASLTDMAEKVKDKSFQLFATALLINNKLGGSLMPVCSRLQEMIQENIKIELKINSLTEYVRTTMLISLIIPFTILFVFYFTSPSLVSFFITDPFGIKLLYIIFCFIVLDVASFRLIVKFVKQ